MKKFLLLLLSLITLPLIGAEVEVERKTVAAGDAEQNPAETDDYKNALKVFLQFQSPEEVTKTIVDAIRLNQNIARIVAKYLQEVEVLTANNPRPFIENPQIPMLQVDSDPLNVESLGLPPEKALKPKNPKKKFKDFTQDSQAHAQKYFGTIDPDEECLLAHLSVGLKATRRGRPPARKFVFCNVPAKLVCYDRDFIKVLGAPHESPISDGVLVYAQTYLYGKDGYPEDRQFKSKEQILKELIAKP